MKRTDLEKLKGLKIDGQMKRTGTPGRYGTDAAVAATSRREQRERERAQGLVPFAVKLDGELVKRVHALALTRHIDLSEATAELLEKGLKD